MACDDSFHPVYDWVTRLLKQNYESQIILKKSNERMSQNE